MKEFLKRNRKTLTATGISIALIVLLAVLATVIFGGFLPKDIVYYEIKFDPNNGGQAAVEPIKVLRGHKVAEFPVPTRTDSTGKQMEFLGWHTDDGVFEYPWVIDRDIVTEDTRLYALWRDPQKYPTEINLQNKAFAVSISWQQTNVQEGVTAFKVYLSDELTPGSYTVDALLSALPLSLLSSVALLAPTK